MDKVVLLGTTPYASTTIPIFCRIEYKEGNLSITGVEGPKKNGNCLGGCGQIVDNLVPAEIQPSKGWTQELIEEFIAVWKLWHLNDMRAGCEHQRAQWRRWTCLECGQQWDSPIRPSSCTPNISGEVTEYCPSCTRRNVWSGTTLPSWGHCPGHYDPMKEETCSSPKRPATSEDIQRAIQETARTGVGLIRGPGQRYYCSEDKMSKPCPVCGYRYGSQWLWEEIPVEVIEFLESLPETEVQPVWV